MIGVPPSAGSTSKRGRRKFLDAKLTEDFKGPARLSNNNTSPPPRIRSKAPTKPKSPSPNLYISDSDDQPLPQPIKNAKKDAASARPKKSTKDAKDILLDVIAANDGADDSDYQVDNTESGEEVISEPRRTRKTVAEAKSKAASEAKAITKVEQSTCQDYCKDIY